MLDALIPRPLSVTPSPGEFVLGTASRLYVASGDPSYAAVAHYLAGCLRPATGYALPVLAAAGEIPYGGIFLSAHPDSTLGDEGYSLVVAPERVTLSAFRPAGLFHAVQTLRQLFPPSIERPTPQPGPWVLPAVSIRDLPRFAWRGFMLDVARHFFPPPAVKRLIDLAAYYKLNRFHLGLTNDQGWRLEIRSWPRLAKYGGSTQVGGGPGGYYTQTEYADLVAYAAARHITIIPEIDAPGHTNAALASYPQLNCNDQAPPLYTGIDVGFSSLCIHKQVTYSFLDDVIGEVAALTPGPYLHIGGDEAHSTHPDDYLYFIERIQAIVASHGKQVVGWEEIARSRLLPHTIVQQWKTDLGRQAADQGARLIVSPGSRAYLDMQYTPECPLGLHWAGYVEVADAYNWDPLSEVSSVSEADLLGVEGCLWSETTQTLADIEYLVFPRLLGLAEIGWSSPLGRAWDEYRLRLASHAPRLQALGVDFYRSPQVPWPE